MIHKVHARGGGGGAGPMDYLLGKDRQREGAQLLRGDPEQLIELVDSLKFSRKYTSGVLSFAEKDIPEADKQKIMDGLEECLLPGLDADQYSVVWVEHRDKGRLELNYVFANVELQSGKRLQPYYDPADRKRVNAWQETVRHDHQLADPNDPARRRALSTPGDLPRDKKQAAEVITAGLIEQMKAGGIKDRADVVQALEQGGFEVVRQVKGSISIKDPSGGKNLRLSGAIYERDFEFSAELSDEIRAESNQYRRGAGERVSEARREYQAHLERKREYLAGRYFREPEAFEGHGVKQLEMDNHHPADAGLEHSGSLGGYGLDDRRQHPENQPTAPDVTELGSAGRADLERSGQVDTAGPEGLADRDPFSGQENRSMGGNDGHQKEAGEQVNEHRSTAGIIQRIRAVASRALEAGRAVAERAAQYLQPLIGANRDLDRAAGQLDRAAGRREQGNSQHSDANQVLEWTSASLDAGVGQLEQAIKEMTPRQRHAVFDRGGMRGPSHDRGGMSM